MRIKGLLGSIFAISLVFGAMALAAGTASAQYDNGRRGGTDKDGYPYWGGSSDMRQTALNAGYNDGTKEGQKDLSRGRRSNYNDFSEYRSANHDYNSSRGDRSLYEKYYRMAFEHGYDAQMNTVNNGGYNNGGYPNNNGGYNNGGYNNGGNNDRDRDRDRNGNGNGTSRGRDWGQYGNYGGDSNSRQTALNAGYNEGIAQGRKDRGRGARDLNSFSQYRNANKDYNSRDGDLGLYQRYYREGFQNGYRDGLIGD